MACRIRMFLPLTALTVGMAVSAPAYAAPMRIVCNASSFDGHVNEGWQDIIDIDDTTQNVAIVHGEGGPQYDASSPHVDQYDSSEIGFDTTDLRAPEGRIGGGGKMQVSIEPPHWKLPGLFLLDCRQQAGSIFRHLHQGRAAVLGGNRWPVISAPSCRLQRGRLR